MTGILIVLCVGLLACGCSGPRSSGPRHKAPAIAPTAQLQEDHVRDLWVSHLTSTKSKAGTDADFFITLGGKEIAFGNWPGDERERGRLDKYHFDVSAYRIPVSAVNENSTYLRTSNNDGWLPARITVTVRTVGGASKSVVDRDWPPIYWFDIDPRDATPPERNQASWPVGQN